MTSKCAYCNNQLTCYVKHDKVIIETVYWNSNLNEYYCNAACSLNRFIQLQGNNNGECIESKTQENTTRND